MELTNIDKKKRFKLTKCFIDISRILLSYIFIRRFIFLLSCYICDYQQR